MTVRVDLPSGIDYAAPWLVETSHAFQDCYSHAANSVSGVNRQEVFEHKATKFEFPSAPCGG